MTFDNCPLAWWMAHGPDMCRRHPVREVVIVGTEPDDEPQGDGSHHYLWWRQIGDRHDPINGTLPPAIYDTMAGGRAKAILRPHMRFRTAHDAVSALNAAAIRWAEAEADSITAPV